LETIGAKRHHSLLEVLNVKLAYMPIVVYLQRSTWSTYFV